MSDTFADPSQPGGGIDYADYQNALLIIDVIEVEKDVATNFGTKDAVRANITAIDGTQAGTTIDDTLIFPKVLVSQLRGNVGKRVLGRLGQGEAKASQKPPWKLLEATPEDRVTAGQFLAGQATTLTADDV